jgi:hypothetical protein
MRVYDFNCFRIGDRYFIWRDSEDGTVFSMSGSDIFMQGSIQSSANFPKRRDCRKEGAGNVSVGMKITKVDEANGYDADDNNNIMLPYEILGFGERSQKGRRRRYDGSHDLVYCKGEM